MNSTIYALCDPDGVIRYIGKAQYPKRRLRQHIWTARGKTDVSRWIRSLETGKAFVGIPLSPERIAKRTATRRARYGINYNSMTKSQRVAQSRKAVSARWGRKHAQFQAALDEMAKIQAE